MWLISVVVVLLPVVQVAPAIYNGIERQRVYRLYSELKRLEDEMLIAPPSRRSKDFLELLERLKDRASHLSMLVSFKPLVYSLRWHIDMVREESRKSLR